jgi:hypothetical protein
MLINRRLFPLRQIGIYLLAAAPFILPVVFGVAQFHGANVSPAERARMDEIYVMFAMPHCCDVFFFMSRIPMGWARAAVIFALAPIVIFAWPHRRAAKIMGAFVAALILFFLAGVLAQRLELYGLLTLYPFQLANALPALFLFVFVGGWIGVGGAARRLGWTVWSLVIAGMLWLVYDRKVASALVEAPESFISEVSDALEAGPAVEEPLYAWIRKNTPRNSVFITPLVLEFWPYAERAQVASMRHPPLDRRIIEWKERLEALNGFRPYSRRGLETGAELAVGERALSIQDLIRIRDRYGATHYMVQGERKDLAEHLLHSDNGYSVYDITDLTSRGGDRR